MPNDESYSVTITFHAVRGVSDLMLRLVRLLGWVDHKNELDSDLRHLSTRRQPVSVRRNGTLAYGSIKVVVTDGK